MTTAHRPTFDPARGKEAQRGPAYHQRLLPAHTVLKTRQPGQGGAAETGVRDLRAELLKAEAAHFAKKNGLPSGDAEEAASEAPKRAIEDEDEDEESPETKRRRLILEEAADLDADSGGSDNESDAESEASSSEEDDDEEDEMAELQRELDKIKRERVEQKQRQEAEKAAADAAQREVDIATGNPLLNKQDFTVKRRWDDDVIFKNQARGTEQKKPKEFVNDLLRSDFHRRFMSRYVR